MEVYSYNHKKYPSPPKQLFGEFWPIQFSKGYSDFYLQYYHKNVLILHHKILNAWIPIAVNKKMFIREAQLLCAPAYEGIELASSQQLLFFNDMIEKLFVSKIAHRIIQPHPAGILSAVPHNVRSIPFGTYIISLNNFNDKDDLLNSFDKKYKKAIQHSIKNGAIVKFGKETYQDFYSLYAATTTRAHIHKDPEEYFNNCRLYLGEGNTETAVVYDGEEPIGGVFITYNKHTAMCTHAGSSGHSKLYGGMKYLHLEMMDHLRLQGVLNYDLVGVRIGTNNEALEGLFRFKRGFGGVLKEGYLWKTDLADTPLKIYDLLQKLRNKNVKDDIIDQELMEI